MVEFLIIFGSLVYIGGFYFYRQWELNKTEMIRHPKSEETDKDLNDERNLVTIQQSIKSLQLDVARIKDLLINKKGLAQDFPDIETLKQDYNKLSEIIIELKKINSSKTSTSFEMKNFVSPRTKKLSDTITQMDDKLLDRHIIYDAIYTPGHVDSLETDQNVLNSLIKQPSLRVYHSNRNDEKRESLQVS